MENGKQNRYLKNTLLFKELNDVLGVETNTRLYVKDGNFQLGYKTIFQNMDLNIPELFVNHSTNESNTFKILKNSTYENVILKVEPVSFEFDSNKRFVSLFAISPEGKVLLLEDNLHVKSKTIWYR